MVQQTHVPKEPEAIAFLKANPGLAALLALSALISVWGLTRSAPKREPIPAAIEPVVEAPAPPVEPEAEAPAPFVFPAPAPEAAPPPAAVAAPASGEAPPPPAAGHRREDGSWESSGGSLP